MDKTIFLLYFCLFVNVRVQKYVSVCELRPKSPFWQTLIKTVHIITVVLIIEKVIAVKKNICIDHKYSLKRGGNCIFCDFMLPQIYTTNDISIELLALKSFTKIIFNDFYTFRFSLHLLCC